MKRTFRVLGEHHIRMMLQAWLGRANLRVVGMSLDMLLQILGPLKGLATEITLVRFQGHVDANVRGDVIALDSGCVAGTPLASQVQVVGALAADMALANVFLYPGAMLVTGETVTINKSP